MMVQFSSLCSSMSKNISNRPGKKNKLGVGRDAVCEMVEEAKRNELMLTSCGVINTDKRENFAAACSKRGKKGLNQDCFLVWEEFGCQEDMTFCGVFDGHGQWGHFVAKRVRELLPQSLLCNWQKSVALNSLNLDSTPNLDNVLFDIWKKSYMSTCASVDQELQRQSGIDSFYSGSTALTLVKQGDLVIVANVGDSRAVLATTLSDGSLVATQLTTDLKPNLIRQNSLFSLKYVPLSNFLVLIEMIKLNLFCFLMIADESKRIAESRGRVHACPDEPGTYRVWMPKGQASQGPGLALSRAFGDYFIKDFGLISEPEVTYRKITTRDRFVILATDGVWDVMSNQEAVDIVAVTLDRAEESAKRLVQCAVAAWKHKGRSAVMDDVSAVCLFFQSSNDVQPINDHRKLNEKFV